MQKSKKNLKIDVPVDVYSLEKHLYSLMYSGVYVTNLDIRKVMKNMGYDIPIDSREALFEKLFVRAEKDNRKVDAYRQLILLLRGRVERYEDLKKMYPGAKIPVAEWISKAENTIFRMRDEMSRMSNAAQ